MRPVIVLFFICITVMAVSACNTVKGVGHDLQAAGSALARAGD